MKEQKSDNTQHVSRKHGYGESSAAVFLWKAIKAYDSGYL